MEAKALLRNVARRMKDDEVISRYASAAASARLPFGRMLFFPVVFVAGMALLPLWDRSVPMAVWAALSGLLALVVDQAVDIARLTRITGALARTAERARQEEPLPHAPSQS